MMNGARITVIRLGRTGLKLGNPSLRFQATSVKLQTKELDMKDSIGYIVIMQACSAAQCERSGSGINTIIKLGLRVGPGILSSLIFIFSQSYKQQAASNKRLKSQAKVSSSEQQASSPEQRASSNKPRASSSKISFPS